MIKSLKAFNLIDLRKYNFLFSHLVIALLISITSCSDDDSEKTSSEGDPSQDQTKTSDQTDKTTQDKQIDQDHSQSSSSSEQIKSDTLEHPSEDLSSQTAKTIQEKFNFELITDLRSPEKCHFIMDLLHQSIINSVFYPHQTLQLSLADTNTMIGKMLENIRFASLKDLSYAQKNFGEKLATTLNNKDCSTLSDFVEYSAQIVANTANNLMIPMMDQLLSLDKKQLLDLINSRDVAKDNYYTLKSLKNNEQLVEATRTLLLLMIQQNYISKIQKSTSPFADAKISSKQQLYNLIINYLNSILDSNLMAIDLLFPIVAQTSQKHFELIDNHPRFKPFFGHKFYSSNLVVENNISHGKIIGMLDDASEQDRELKIGDKLHWYKTPLYKNIIKFASATNNSFIDSFLFSGSLKEDISVNVDKSHIGQGVDQKYTIKSSLKSIDDIPSMSSAIVSVYNSYNQKPVKIGYLFIKKFFGFQNEIGGSAKLISQNIDELKKQGADILFIDISLADANVSKASFLEAIKVHDLFVKQNSTVYAYNRSYHNFSANTELEVIENTDSVYQHDQIPIVLYVGFSTFGPFELLAALFKLSKRGVVLGNSATKGYSFTKKMFYTKNSLGTDVAFGTTPGTAFFLADGSTFLKKGVSPDIMFDDISIDIGLARPFDNISLSVNEMIEHLDHQPSTQFQPYNLNFVNDQLIQELAKSSSQRIDQDNKLQLIKANLPEKGMLTYTKIYQIIHSIPNGPVDLDDYTAFKELEPAQVPGNLMIARLQTKNLKTRIIYEHDQSIKTKYLKKMFESSPDFKEAMTVTADYFSLCTSGKTDEHDKPGCEISQPSAK